MTRNPDHTSDTELIDLAAIELAQHLHALRRGEPLSEMHRAQAYECLDILAGGI